MFLRFVTQNKFFVKNITMYQTAKKRFQKEIEDIKLKGLFKEECLLDSAQAASISANGKEMLNFCANNYLGLSNHPSVIKAAQKMMEARGFGLASVRFICGTQDIHKKLEKEISSFLGTEDTILYAAAFDANGGVFEPLLGPEDAIISDALNHASIIDGVRLCKAQRFRYQHNNMLDLELKLQEASGARTKIIVTDGVFSMDGTIAQLDIICDLAERYNALVMTDECHATGFIGPTGRGVPELKGVSEKVDIITGTLGKALGGASGGFTSGRKEIITLLRQRSRPYLFSNSLAPAIVGASLKVFKIIKENKKPIEQLRQNTFLFRQKMTEAGFDVVPGEHPIVPIMLYDAKLAQNMATALLEKDIYVVGFFYPVVPEGKARIRVQLSAAHTESQINKTVAAFVEVGKSMGII